MCKSDGHHSRSACCVSHSMLVSSHVILFNPHNPWVGCCYHCCLENGVQERELAQGHSFRVAEHDWRPGQLACVLSPPLRPGPSKHLEEEERLGGPPPAPGQQPSWSFRGCRCTLSVVWHRASPHRIFHALQNADCARRFTGSRAVSFQELSRGPEVCGPWRLSPAPSLAASGYYMAL